MPLDPFAFAVDLADQAGSLLCDFFSRRGLTASQKPDLTVVTEADLAADHLISYSIQEAFPADGIITEESHHSIHNTQGKHWIIDPLDGSSNFSLGLPIWGISIAHLSGGLPDFAVMYFPLLHERYTARLGQGGFLNDQVIHTRPPDPSQPMSFFACCSRTFRLYDVKIPYKPRILGSSVYSFCLAARGAALIAFDATPKIWDLAAGWLLIQEAGGAIQTLHDPQPFPIVADFDFSAQDYPLIAAANPSLLEYGLARIRKK